MQAVEEKAVSATWAAYILQSMYKGNVLPCEIMAATFLPLRLSLFHFFTSAANYHIAFSKEKSEMNKHCISFPVCNHIHTVPMLIERRRSIKI